MTTSLQYADERMLPYLDLCDLTGTDAEVGVPDSPHIKDVPREREYVNVQLILEGVDRERIMALYDVVVQFSEDIHLSVCPEGEYVDDRPGVFDE